VTGDTVNLAARLEQAAEPDEILVGPETHRLVRDAILVEPVEPL
jgi:class 3 adenylate cyclase